MLNRVPLQLETQAVFQLFNNPHEPAFPSSWLFAALVSSN